MQLLQQDGPQLATLIVRLSLEEFRSAESVILKFNLLQGHFLRILARSGETVLQIGEVRVTRKDAASVQAERDPLALQLSQVIER